MGNCSLILGVWWPIVCPRHLFILACWVSIPSSLITHSYVALWSHPSLILRSWEWEGLIDLICGKCLAFTNTNVSQKRSHLLYVYLCCHDFSHSLFISQISKMNKWSFSSPWEKQFFSTSSKAFLSVFASLPFFLSNSLPMAVNQWFPHCFYFAFQCSNSMWLVIKMMWDFYTFRKTFL